MTCTVCFPLRHSRVPRVSHFFWAPHVRDPTTLLGGTVGLVSNFFPWATPGAVPGAQWQGVRGAEWCRGCGADLVRRPGLWVPVPRPLPVSLRSRSPIMSLPADSASVAGQLQPAAGLSVATAPVFGQLGRPLALVSATLPLGDPGVWRHPWESSRTHPNAVMGSHEAVRGSQLGWVVSPGGPVLEGIPLGVWA